MSATRSNTAFKSAIGVGLLIGCLAIAGNSLSGAGQSPRPGESASPTEPTVDFQLLDAQASPIVFSHATTARDALGFPVGVSRTGKHVKDGFQHAEYDEVDELDAAGQPISMTQLDKSGRVMSAVRLDASPRPATRIGRDSALQAAQRGASAAGMAAGGTASANVDPATDGWTVRWSRIQDGIGVRGDETTVQVRPDGRIQSLARVEHQLAAAPAQRIKADEAKQFASNKADLWFRAHGSDYSIDSMDLEWVGPNGAFDAGKSIDPQPVYRLAWVANVKPSGDASKYLWMVTVYLDAGDGSLLGGDFVE